MEAEKLVTEPLHAPQHLKNAEIIVDILVVELLEFYHKIRIRKWNIFNLSSSSNLIKVAGRFLIHQQQVQGVIKHKCNDHVLTLFIPRGLATMGRRTLFRS